MQQTLFKHLEQTWTGRLSSWTGWSSYKGIFQEVDKNRHGLDYYLGGPPIQNHLPTSLSGVSERKRGKCVDMVYHIIFTDNKK